MGYWEWDQGLKGFLLSQGDRTSCGGFILPDNDSPSIRGMKIACEGDEYICGIDGRRYQIEGGVPNGSHIEVGHLLFRNTFKNIFDDDIDHEGRKIIPHSKRFKKMQEEAGLLRRSSDSLRDFDERFEHDDFIGSAGGVILGRKRIITGKKENTLSIPDFRTGFRTRISKHLFDAYSRMGKDLSDYETEIICLLAGSAHSRGSCNCHCRFIPRLNITYRYDEYLLLSFQAANSNRNTKSETPPVQHRPIQGTRQPVEPGFCVVPDMTTPKLYEKELMDNPLPGVKELYRMLNPEKSKKPGSILIVVDPEKKEQKQIQILQNARDRIDKALAPLSVQEAKLLHENRTPVDIFSSQIYSDTLGTSGDILGYVKDAGGEYYKEINKTLNEIQELYKRTYGNNSGIISGEEFFGQRARLFKKLDGILNRYSKEQLNLEHYEDIKKALGLSTRSIMHRWNQTGIQDIEGYASYIEKSAKLIKIMRATGYVGIGLDFASYTTNVYEACARGRESECRKAAITEYSKFGGKQATSLVGGAAGGVMGRAACTWILGLITSEAGGAGASICLVSGIASSIAGEKIAEKWGEVYGEKIGSAIYNKTVNSNPIIHDPDSFNEDMGIILYEKLFNQ